MLARSLYQMKKFWNKSEGFFTGSKKNHQCQGNYHYPSALHKYVSEPPLLLHCKFSCLHCSYNRDINLFFQGFCLYISLPPSDEEIETMDICKRIQNDDKSDNSLDAFLEAEETNDDEETIVGTSQQQAKTKESDIIELDQISSSAT